MLEDAQGLPEHADSGVSTVFKMVRFSRSKRVHAEVTSLGQGWILDHVPDCVRALAPVFVLVSAACAPENILTLLVNEEVAHMKCRLWGGRDVQRISF